MDNALQIILKKLDNIENRLKILEQTPTAANQTVLNTRDPLFPKAVEIIDKYEEISAQELASQLKVDLKRAEKIMDELEKAGLGTCYTKEV